MAENKPEIVKKRRGAKPGHPKFGGRQKGSLNKVTRTVKEALSLIADQGVEAFPLLVARVAETDPRAAAALYLDVMEYVQPKLSRQEQTGADGVPLGLPVINIHPVRAAKRKDDE